MGGYLAARWTELHPDRVDRLILLCPGFDMAHRWLEILGPELLSSWEKEGSLSFADGTGRPTEVHWGLMEDGRNHPAYPEVPCPTVIIHGTKDDQVPISSSQDYAYGHAERRLMEVDDDHGLMDSLPLIRDTVASFFEFDLVRTEE
jgi:pimeloyl-ACP methyl ester carboxylesterase